MHIRINQAYRGCSKIHFYVTINKGLKNEFEFHMCWEGSYEKTSKFRKRWHWMYDFYNIGDIEFNTNKYKQRYEEYLFGVRQKMKSKDRVKVIVGEYKYYLQLKEKFNF